jgi:hypothetical protein
VSPTGGELERRPDRIPAPYLPPERTGERTGERAGERTGETAGPLEAAEVVGWPELAAWLRGHGTVLTGLILIVVQLIWRSLFLTHYYFWQDDFHFIELGLAHSFTWKYLTIVEAGHLTPGGFAIAWAAGRVSLYNWGLASAVTIVMVAAADLAALRLLRTLFGNRPVILVPLLVLLATPLTVPDIRWWAAAIESVPLQTATLMALNAQVHYVRTGRFRHAWAVAAWLLFGLVFFEKAVVLPLLLLGITSGFLMEGPWPRAIWRCLVTYWRSWLLQLAILAGYAVVFVESLRTSATQPGSPGTVGGIFTFTWEILKDTFLPGAIGGPWQWLPSGDSEYAYSAPPAALAWLSVIVAATVVLSSIVSRRYAWRAWAILAAWLGLADVAPVLLGRISELGPTFLGLETRYVADAVPVLVICLGLAFFPVLGTRESLRTRQTPMTGNQAGRLVAAAAVGAFVIGSVWSVQAFENVTSSLPDRTFLENARVAVGQAPSGTVVADEPVPPALMLGTFGAYASASRVIGPMESPSDASRIHWTAQPDGTIDRLMVFGVDGRLHEAAMFGETSIPINGARQCQAESGGRAVVRFTTPTSSHQQELHLAYLTIAAVAGRNLTVTYSGAAHQLILETGLHGVYIPVSGRADSVTVSGPALAGVCLGSVQVGLIVPSASGPVIPAAY